MQATSRAVSDFLGQREAEESWISVYVSFLLQVNRAYLYALPGRLPEMMLAVKQLYCSSQFSGLFHSHLVCLLVHKLESSSLPSFDPHSVGPLPSTGSHCRDGECAACDSKVDAADLASIDVRSLGYNSSTSAYVHCVQVDIDSQVRFCLGTDVNWSPTLTVLT